MHKRKIIAASVLLAPFALAAIFLFLDSETPPVSPSQVYTWDCEYPEQKPEAITLTCADGGIYIDQIDWSRWSSKGAQGIGIYNVNNCNPNCAEGTYVKARVKIHLLKLVPYEGDYFLKTLEIRTFAGENLPNRQESSFAWDVMEFAEIMGGIVN
jgi:hypothetical protein